MKNVYKLLILTIILTVYSCKEDEKPAVIPTTTFTHDRTFIETNEDITFTNNSSDAVSYSWDFGDNSSPSTSENPVHTYTTTGNFLITLTGTSETGDETISTSTVTVGNRWTVGLGIEFIPFTDLNGDPWDDDDTGPDLFFGFAKATAQSFRPYTVTDGLDLVASDFPFGGTIPPANQEILTNEDWAFIFIDNEDPQEDLTVSTVMASILVNPVTVESNKNYDDGTGTFVFQSIGFSFLVAFEIRAN